LHRGLDLGDQLRKRRRRSVDVDRNLHGLFDPVYR
jgi:hypothetical protein